MQCKAHSVQNGYFGFNLTPFFDKAKLNVNLYTTENKAKDARIRFERSIVPKIRVYNGNELLLNTSKNKVSYLIEKDQNDHFNSDSALFNYLDAGIMLEQVDIKARQYVDFDTFSAFDVEKDNDAMLDYYKTEYLDTPAGSLPQDFRRTLFWDPNVITDSLGNAQIEFYNNAYSRHFHISGSGITASGTPYCLDQDF